MIIELNKTDISIWVDSSIYIRENTDGLGSNCKFAYSEDNLSSPTINTGDRITVTYDDGSQLFDGIVSDVTRGINSRTNSVGVTAIDETFFLKWIDVNKSYDNTNTVEILEDVLAGTGFTVDCPVVKVRRISFNRSNARDVVYKISTIVSKSWFIKDSVIYFVSPEDEAEYTLDLYKGSLDPYNYRISRDSIIETEGVAIPYSKVNILGNLGPAEEVDRVSVEIGSDTTNFFIDTIITFRRLVSIVKTSGPGGYGPPVFVDVIQSDNTAAKGSFLAGTIRYSFKETGRDVWWEDVSNTATKGTVTDALRTNTFVQGASYDVDSNTVFVLTEANTVQQYTLDETNKSFTDQGSTHDINVSPITPNAQTRAVAYNSGKIYVLYLGQDFISVFDVATRSRDPVTHTIIGASVNNPAGLTETPFGFVLVDDGTNKGICWNHAFVRIPTFDFNLDSANTSAETVVSSDTYLYVGNFGNGNVYVYNFIDLAPLPPQGTFITPEYEKELDITSSPTSENWTASFADGNFLYFFASDTNTLNWIKTDGTIGGISTQSFLEDDNDPGCAAYDPSRRKLYVANDETRSRGSNTFYVYQYNVTGAGRDLEFTYNNKRFSWTSGGRGKAATGMTFKNNNIYIVFNDTRTVGVYDILNDTYDHLPGLTLIPANDRASALAATPFGFIVIDRSDDKGYAYNNSWEHLEGFDFDLHSSNTSGLAAASDGLRLYVFEYDDDEIYVYRYVEVEEILEPETGTMEIPAGTGLIYGNYGLDSEDTTKDILWSQSGRFIRPGLHLPANPLREGDSLTITGYPEVTIEGEVEVLPADYSDKEINNLSLPINTETGVTFDVGSSEATPQFILFGRIFNTNSNVEVEEISFAKAPNETDNSYVPDNPYLHILSIDERSLQSNEIVASIKNATTIPVVEDKSWTTPEFNEITTLSKEANHGFFVYDGYIYYFRDNLHIDSYEIATPSNYRRRTFSWFGGESGVEGRAIDFDEDNEVLFICLRRTESTFAGNNKPYIVALSLNSSNQNFTELNSVRFDNIVNESINDNIVNDIAYRDSKLYFLFSRDHKVTWFSVYGEGGTYSYINQTSKDIPDAELNRAFKGTGYGFAMARTVDSKELIQSFNAVFDRDTNLDIDPVPNVPIVHNMSTVGLTDMIYVQRTSDYAIVSFSYHSETVESPYVRLRPRNEIPFLLRRGQYIIFVSDVLSHEFVYHKPVYETQFRTEAAAADGSFVASGFRYSVGFNLERDVYYESISHPTSDRGVITNALREGTTGSTLGAIGASYDQETSTAFVLTRGGAAARIQKYHLNTSTHELTDTGEENDIVVQSGTGYITEAVAYREGRLYVTFATKSFVYVYDAVTGDRITPNKTLVGTLTSEGLTATGFGFTAVNGTDNKGYAYDADFNRHATFDFDLQAPNYTPSTVASDGSNLYVNDATEQNTVYVYDYQAPVDTDLIPIAHTPRYEYEFDSANRAPVASFIHDGVRYSFKIGRNMWWEEIADPTNSNGEVTNALRSTGGNIHGATFDPGTETVFIVRTAGAGRSVIQQYGLDATNKTLTDRGSAVDIPYDGPSSVTAHGIAFKAGKLYVTLSITIVKVFDASSGGAEGDKRIPDDIKNNGITATSYGFAIVDKATDKIYGLDDDFNRLEDFDTDLATGNDDPDTIASDDDRLYVGEDGSDNVYVYLYKSVPGDEPPANHKPEYQSSFDSANSTPDASIITEGFRFSFASANRNMWWEEIDDPANTKGVVANSFDTTGSGPWGAAYESDSNTLFLGRTISGANTIQQFTLDVSNKTLEYKGSSFDITVADPSSGSTVARSLALKDSKLYIMFRNNARVKVYATDGTEGTQIFFTNSVFTNTPDFVGFTATNYGFAAVGFSSDIIYSFDDDLNRLENFDIDAEGASVIGLSLADDDFNLYLGTRTDAPAVAPVQIYNYRSSPAGGEPMGEYGYTGAPYVPKLIGTEDFVTDASGTTYNYSFIAGGYWYTFPFIYAGSNNGRMVRVNLFDSTDTSTQDNALEETSLYKGITYDSKTKTVYALINSATIIEKYTLDESTGTLTYNGSSEDIDLQTFQGVNTGRGFSFVRGITFKNDKIYVLCVDTSNDFISSFSVTDPQPTVPVDKVGHPTDFLGGRTSDFVATDFGFALAVRENIVGSASLTFPFGIAAYDNDLNRLTSLDYGSEGGSSAADAVTNITTDGGRYYFSYTRSTTYTIFQYRDFAAYQFVKYIGASDYQGGIYSPLLTAFISEDAFNDYPNLLPQDFSFLEIIFNRPQARDLVENQYPQQLSSGEWKYRYCPMWLKSRNSRDRDITFFGYSPISSIDAAKSVARELTSHIALPSKRLDMTLTNNRSITQTPAEFNRQIIIPDRYRDMIIAPVSTNLVSVRNSCLIPLLEGGYRADYYDLTDGTFLAQNLYSGNEEQVTPNPIPSGLRLEAIGDSYEFSDSEAVYIDHTSSEVNMSANIFIVKPSGPQVWRMFVAEDSAREYEYDYGQNKPVINSETLTGIAPVGVTIIKSYDRESYDGWLFTAESDGSSKIYKFNPNIVLIDNIADLKGKKIAIDSDYQNDPIIFPNSFIFGSVKGFRFGTESLFWALNRVISVNGEYQYSVICFNIDEETRTVNRQPRFDIHRNSHGLGTVYTPQGMMSDSSDTLIINVTDAHGNGKSILFRVSLFNAPVNVGLIDGFKLGDVVKVKTRSAEEEGENFMVIERNIESDREYEKMRIRMENIVSDKGDDISANLLQDQGGSPPPT